MADVVFPPFSTADSDAVGVVTSWFVADGAAVQAGEVLGEVQVDKVAADVAAPVSGRVRLLVAEESEVPPGTVIATVS